MKAFRPLAVCVFALVIAKSSFAGPCAQFSGSTMEAGDGPIAAWRTDYPDRAPSFPSPWQDHDFETDPKSYMEAVLSQVRPGFLIEGDRLVGTGDENWWISIWMDYMSAGRERRMGLTKERGPNAGDLAPGSSNQFQVWAVGFYNVAGATTLGDIFSEPCDPSLPVQVDFPNDTVSVKFLFTNADPNQVTYLQGAPEYRALIDPTPRDGLPEDRVETVVRLLQVDLAVKDRRATDTGWVFGTFAWIGPKQGDGLFDNLQPVSLQWGDDPGVYNREIRQSWINPDLSGVLYGWESRPTLGFNGRANGPADNIRSSCISCHSSARTPRSSLGLLGSRFNMETDILDPLRVIAHVDTWFTNRTGSEVFTPSEPAASVLDYSLQLDAAIFRMCRACQIGDLAGLTPGICRSIGFFNRPNCGPTSRSSLEAMRLSEEARRELESLLIEPPARQ